MTELLEARPNEAGNEATVEIEAERNGLFNLRNAIASAHTDGRFPSDEGKRLRGLIPSPNDTLTSATFEVSADDATLIADAMNEAANVSFGDGRNATGRRQEREMFEVRVAVGRLPEQAAEQARNQPDPARQANNAYDGGEN